MRNNHESLRNGKLTYLNVYDLNNNIHNNVLAYARSSPEETGIIIINFYSQTVKFIFLIVLIKLIIKIFLKSRPLSI